MKKSFIITLAVVAVLVSILLLWLFVFKTYNKQDSEPSIVIQPTNTVSSELDKYDIYIKNIINTQLQKDSIPPIDSPLYVSIDEADKFLTGADKVFVYESKDGVFIYPQRILVWHEIVNDDIDGESISVTYCPLTGSVICYLGDVSSNTDNTYGTSGKLLNSNLLMYDRQTDSYIPQILGKGINNELEGATLDTRPIHWANWADVKTAYSDAQILSMQTGFDRDYFLDPYGSYEFINESSYYQNDDIMFPPDK